MESPHDTYRLRYITSDLIYIDLKSKIFILTVETFRNDWFSNLKSNAFFWLEIIIYEILLTFRESLLVLSQLLTTTISLFTEAWTLSMTLSDAKTVVPSEKLTSTYGLWIYACHWYAKKKKYWAQHRSLRNT